MQLNGNDIFMGQLTRSICTCLRRKQRRPAPYERAALSDVLPLLLRTRLPRRARFGSGGRHRLGRTLRMQHLQLDYLQRVNIHVMGYIIGQCNI